MSLPLKISLGGAKSSNNLKKNTSQNGSVGLATQTKQPVKKSLALNDDDDIDQHSADNFVNNNKANKRKAGGSQHNLYGGASASKNSQVLSREQRLRMAEAQSLDASVFSYDEVYDNMKKREREAEEAKKIESVQRKPKYVEGLQKAAEQRKSDRTRAEDKMIARERATEGDLYKDKDSFVTDAYREQQAELRKAEEEDRKREEQNAGRKGGLASFYSAYLNDKEKKHTDAMEGAKLDNAEAPTESKQEEVGPSDAQLAKETEQKLGRKVTLNEDGQIVDRRELLTGGLNVSKPKRIGPSSGPQLGGFALTIAEREEAAKKEEEEERKKKEEEDLFLHGGLTAEQRGKLSRQRLSKEIERQLAELEKKKAEEEKQKFDDSIKMTFSKRNDESKVEAMRRAAMERRKKREREKREQEAVEEADQR